MSFIHLKTNSVCVCVWRSCARLLLSHSHSPVEAPPPALVAMVNVYVLVTSVTPLTSFLHDVSVVMTNQEPRGRVTKVNSSLS